jgi:hypothetical protein
MLAFCFGFCVFITALSYLNEKLRKPCSKPKSMTAAFDSGKHETKAVGYYHFLGV